MKLFRILLICSMPIVMIGLIAVIGYNAEHNSYTGPDPATGRVVEMHGGRHGDHFTYYVTPWGKQFETWMPVGIGVFLLVWGVAVSVWRGAWVEGNRIALESVRPRCPLPA